MFIPLAECSRYFGMWTRTQANLHCFQECPHNVRKWRNTHSNFYGAWPALEDSQDIRAIGAGSRVFLFLYKIASKSIYTEWNFLWELYIREFLHSFRVKGYDHLFSLFMNKLMDNHVGSDCFLPFCTFTHVFEQIVQDFCL